VAVNYFNETGNQRLIAEAKNKRVELEICPEKRF